MYIFTLLVLTLAKVIIAYDCENGNEFLYSGLQEEDRLAILTYHAKFRYFAAKGLIPQQSQGVDFVPLRWDNKLENIATNSLNICNNTLHITNYGQWPKIGKAFVSHYLPTLPVPDWEHVMNEIYLEHKDFEYPGVNNTKSKYAQVVSASTENIGCSFLAFKTIEESYPYVAIYLCLYGPGVTDAAPYSLKY